MEKFTHQHILVWDTQRSWMSYRADSNLSRHQQVTIEHSHGWGDKGHGHDNVILTFWTPEKGTEI